MRRMERSPSDEILLTELALDDKEFEIYDITSLIMCGDSRSTFAQFKCYMDNSSKEFYIEINENTPMSNFTKDTLLRMLDMAEKEGAKRVYAAIRKEIVNTEKLIKHFMFVGFEALNEEEIKEVSMTETHMLVKYDIEEEEESESSVLEDTFEEDF